MDLREIRKSHSLTMRQAAEKLKISDATLSLIETGKRKPSIKIAKRISKLFKISLDEIYKDA